MTAADLHDIIKVMLVARTQLDLVKIILADFARPTSEMRSIAQIIAQQVAIVTLLRAVGHVLHKVDADTRPKQKWLKERWSYWQKEPIFAGFIELDRNRLLKEHRGVLDLNNPAIGSSAVVTNPSMPKGVGVHVEFYPEKLTTTQGRLLELFNDAVEFWESRLREAEQAFESR